MATAAPAPRTPRLPIHYGWIVVAITFWVVLVAAGSRATPGILMTGMENEMGWTAATISIAVSINIILFGLMGPFAAALMQTIGIRQTMLIGLGMIAISTFATSKIHTPWQLMLTWGLGVGLGVGMTGVVMSATVATRWFAKRRGLAVGMLSSASAIGQLIFLPFLAVVAQRWGWRDVGIIVACVAILASIPVILFMRERPETMGLKPYGAEPDEAARESPLLKGNPIRIAFSALGRATYKRDFWLLCSTFFVCGASANGFIGTHFIPACGDHGIPEIQAAGYLAMMGAFNLCGATLSGYLSDRIDCRYVLLCVYGFRGISLFFVPYAFAISGPLGLPLFALFYGLDWIATLPPTLKLTVNAFGRDDGPVVFGWIQTSHQVGAALIALTAGLIRTVTLSYNAAFDTSAVLCLCAAVTVLAIGRSRRKPGEPSERKRREIGPAIPAAAG